MTDPLAGIQKIDRPLNTEELRYSVGFPKKKFRKDDIPSYIAQTTEILGERPNFYHEDDRLFVLGHSQVLQ